jgi:hypothetical protein
VILWQYYSKFVAKMKKCQEKSGWLVVLLLPRLENRVMGRYRLRSDAEVHACKLRRMLGDSPAGTFHERYGVRVVFEG